jgi:ketosteroid isomerase-like protein
MDRSARGAGHEAARLVEEYLIRCEARDLAAASRLLAPDPLIVFPGGVHYRTLAEMVADAATRYRTVRKRRRPPVLARCDDGATVVLSHGTLEGEGLDGAPFAGIRYLDVFIVRDGQICEQHVFNDLAEAGVVARGRHR